MFYSSFLVFAITLLLTKSKILACKRQFVEKRYKAAFVGDQKPSMVHRWFHSLWTCPMCSGFWIAVLVCPFVPEKFYFADILVTFGLNWFYHCLENWVFHAGKIAEKNLEKTV